MSKLPQAAQWGSQLEWYVGLYLRLHRSLEVWHDGIHTGAWVQSQAV